MADQVVALLVAAYELMRIGLRPVVYESSHLGGRLRSQPFEGADGIVAELGGMRFPRSSTAFHHYVDLLGLPTAPFPNPLTEAAGTYSWAVPRVSTLEDLAALKRSGLDMDRDELTAERSSWTKPLRRTRWPESTSAWCSANWPLLSKRAAFAIIMGNASSGGS